MSAMRVLTREELYQQLRGHGFQETNLKTDSHTVWHHAKTGRNFTVPNSDTAPDYVLDQCLRGVNELYTDMTGDSVSSKDYAVSTKENAKIIPLTRG